MGKTRDSANLVSDNNIKVDIDNDRVGIGTSTPAYDLDVVGDVNFSGTLYQDGSEFTISSVPYATISGIATYAAVSGIATYATVSGIATYATVSGIATYATVSGIATVSEGLTGTPNITVGSITASTASFSGNVSVAGTLTYEDVTNVDSVGLVTARTGIRVTDGGLIISSGISTISGGVNFDKILKEGVNITAGKLSDNTNINLENGMVHLFTTTETTTSTPNIRYNSSISLDSQMNIGESITVSIITTAAAAGYSAQLNIDGSSVTEEWLGGSAPSTGGSSGYDVYTYNIIKTASATFVVLANIVNFA